MSLFGESPPERPTSVAAANSKSLFGDDSKPQAASSSSLFDSNTDDSPWSLPTPKKAARQNLVKQLLPATQVPESYIDAFDNIINSGDSHGTGVSVSVVQKVLGSSGLTPSEQDQISSIVLPAGKDSTSALGRNEFNVLLALIGLGQEEEEISLDSVDERRKRNSINSGLLCHFLTLLRSPRTSNQLHKRPKDSTADSVQKRALPITCTGHTQADIQAATGLLWRRSFE